MALNLKLISTIEKNGCIGNHNNPIYGELAVLHTIRMEREKQMRRTKNLLTNTPMYRYRISLTAKRLHNRRVARIRLYKKRSWAIRLAIP